MLEEARVVVRSWWQSRAIHDMGGRADLEVTMRNLHEMEARMTMRFLAGNVWSEERVEWEPDGPWQRVRAAVLPDWWLRRRPVKSREMRRVYEVWHVCPHEDLLTHREGGMAHLYFMRPKRPAP